MFVGADSFGGQFDANQGFVGGIGDVYFWDQVKFADFGTTGWCPIHSSIGESCITKPMEK